MKKEIKMSSIKILIVFMLSLVFLSGLACVMVSADGGDGGDGGDGDRTTPTLSPTPIPGTSVKASIDYQKSGYIIKINGTKTNERFYFSTDKKKTWERIETGVASNSVELDVKTLMKTSAVTIFFKGDKDTEPLEFVIPAEDKDLKVAYAMNEKGEPHVTFTNAKWPLEYRIGTDGNWAEIRNETEANRAINSQSFEVFGATLQIRSKATATTRPGKIVSLKIPKRQKAPAVKINSSKLVLSGLKPKSMEYRVVEGGKVSKEWTLYQPSDDKAKEASIVSVVLGSQVPYNTKIPKAVVEFRSLPTKKSGPSAIRTIEIEPQRSAPTLATVRLNQTTLSITDASSSNPYEYIAIKSTEESTLDLGKAKWKSVTNDKEQLIKIGGKGEAVIGDKIYVRYKSGKDKATGQEILASQYLVLAITSMPAASPAVAD